MPRHRSTLKLRRKQLDRTLQPLSDLRRIAVPPVGWLRSIREALGMSTYDLARLARLDPSTIRATEGREANGAVTLETLRRLAGQLDCDLAYFLLPRQGTLEETLQARALKVAEALVEPVHHTMSLEAQSLAEDARREQIRELAVEMVHSQSAEIWNEVSEP